MSAITNLIKLDAETGATELNAAEAFINYFNTHCIYLNDALAIFNISKVNTAKQTVSKFFMSGESGASQFFGAVGNGITQAAIDVPLPMIGFYFNPKQVEILKCKYSEYPYLNKNLLTDGVMLENTTFKVEVYKTITTLNTCLANTLTNDLINIVLKEYVSRGGTFTACTPFGNFSPLGLTNWSGVVGGNPGTKFEMTFTKLNIINGTGTESLSSAMSSISRGGI